jgi:predicted CopG family antitoxin
MAQMEGWTTIMIRKETRDRLKSLRITKRESYDEIIKRMIEKCGRSGQGKS